MLDGYEHPSAVMLFLIEHELLGMPSAYHGADQRVERDWIVWRVSGLACRSYSTRGQD